MNKKTEINLFSVFLIIVSIVSIFFKEYVYGILLFIFSIVINKDFTKIIIKFLKFLWYDFEGDKTLERMKASEGGIIQKSERDSIVKYVINAETVILNSPQSKISKVESKENAAALREIYKKMIKPLKLLNLAANVGLKNEEEFKEINESIEDFINTKMENEIDFPNELKNKLNEVMGAFRFTINELLLKLKDKKFNEGLHGTKSFDFIIKCKEATAEIEKLLK